MLAALADDDPLKILYGGLEKTRRAIDDRKTCTRLYPASGVVSSTKPKRYCELNSSSISKYGRITNRV
jgi:hypothetical protein